MVEFLVGTLMVGGTLTPHAIGSARWLNVVGRWHEKIGASKNTGYLFSSIVSTGVVLLILHVIETTLWAALYWGLPARGGLASFREAAYFSMVTFTSLGYGDVTLSQEWQILAPMESMVGITVATNPGRVLARIRSVS